MCLDNFAAGDVIILLHFDGEKANLKFSELSKYHPYHFWCSLMLAVVSFAQRSFTMKCPDCREHVFLSISEPSVYSSCFILRDFFTIESRFLMKFYSEYQTSKQIVLRKVLLKPRSYIAALNNPAILLQLFQQVNSIDDFVKLVDAVPENAVESLWSAILILDSTHYKVTHRTSLIESFFVKFARSLNGKADISILIKNAATIQKFQNYSSFLAPEVRVLVDCLCCLSKPNEYCIEIARLFAGTDDIKDLLKVLKKFELLFFKRFLKIFFWKNIKFLSIMLQTSNDLPDDLAQFTNVRLINDVLVTENATEIEIMIIVDCLRQLRCIKGVDVKLSKGYRLVSAQLEELVRAFESIEKLEMLGLQLDLDESQTEFLLKSVALDKAKFVDLSTNKISSVAVSNLKFQLHDTKLTFFGLDDCSISAKDIECLLKQSFLRHDLKSLHISRNEFSNKAETALIELVKENAYRLQSLHLAHLKIAPETLGKLFIQFNFASNLVELDVSGLDHIDMVIESLASVLRQASHLFNLSLAETDLTDSNFRTIFEALRFAPDLAKLDVSNNRLTSKSWSLIKDDLVKKHSLKFVDVSVNPFIINSYDMRIKWIPDSMAIEMRIDMRQLKKSRRLNEKCSLYFLPRCRIEPIPSIW